MKFKIFPCVKEGKTPLIPNWSALATDNTETIAAWGKAYKGCNWGVACGASGITVIDVDFKHPKGKESWNKLLEDLPELKNSIDYTYKVLTPSGGYHYYYEGVVNSSNGKVYEGIDIKSAGGYVVAEGSVYEGKHYTLAQALAVVPLPHTAREKFVNYSTKQRKGEYEEEGRDKPRDIEKAVHYLQERVSTFEATTAQGANGDPHMYEVCCGLLQRGISKEKAVQLILEHYNPHCTPLWDYGELTAKINSAVNSGQNVTGTGSLATPELSEVFKGLKPPERKTEGFLTDYEDFLAEGEEKIEWLIYGFLPAKSVVTLSGDSGVGKSFFALDIALSLSSGYSDKWAVYRKHTVVYLTGEPSSRNRGLSWKAAYPEASDVRGYFHQRRELKTALDVEYWQTLKEYLEENAIKPELIILDTFALFAQDFDENNAQEVTKVIEIAKQLRNYYDCTVLIIHHNGKNSRYRGSSAFFANVDGWINMEAVEGLESVVKIYPTKLREAKKTESLILQLTDVGLSAVFYKYEGEIPSKDTKKSPNKIEVNAPYDNYSYIYNLVKACGLPEVSLDHMAEQICKDFGETSSVKIKNQLKAMLGKSEYKVFFTGKLTHYGVPKIC